MSMTLPVSLLIAGFVIVFLAFVSILVNGARFAKNIGQHLGEAMESPSFPNSFAPFGKGKAAPLQLGKRGKSHLIAMGFMAFGGLTALIGVVIFIARLAAR